ncbi:chloramphenicol acetyltransferase [Flavobacterium sp. MEB061]|uniref:CatB-related O-acetyltransferase n=1 Tax=Flavobacterium sp. MEB061 TaxID=1587524 RepID=UPI0005B6AF94|nr:CatB-related O-acetyltransferase [Flavobacterium sp. MEB061]KIQ18727.1 chloramphenicol acetyltransferase [Flavobacterium sp. MEB061]
MKKVIKNKIISFLDFVIKKTIIAVYGVNSNIYKLLFNNIDLKEKEQIHNSILDKNVKLYTPYKLVNSNVGEYTYIAENVILNNTTIGKFCSIGPNLLSGWGIHPTNGLSTHPMFYSTQKQNGITLSEVDKIEETKNITIGNDVFIGMNVTILDGVKIGDGAVIGAGALVSKDIPAYAIAVGNPIRIIKYRFDDAKIDQLLKIKWWDFEKTDLSLVEKYFFEVDEFLNKFI